MESKTMVFCSIAVIFAIMEIVSSEDNTLDNNLGDEIGRQRRMSPSDIEAFKASQGDIDDLSKKSSLLRFGKRGSLLRFGKRGSLLRFGKRGSLLRFGKRYYEDVPEGSWIPESYLEAMEPSDEGVKRGSLLRFGKKSALFRYGRSVDEGPHTPFRFGREEDE